MNIGSNLIKSNHSANAANSVCISLHRVVYNEDKTYRMDSMPIIVYLGMASYANLINAYTYINISLTALHILYYIYSFGRQRSNLKMFGCL